MPADSKFLEDVRKLRVGDKVLRDGEWFTIRTIEFQWKYGPSTATCIAWCYAELEPNNACTYGFMAYPKLPLRWFDFCAPREVEAAA